MPLEFQTLTTSLAKHTRRTQVVQIVDVAFRCWTNARQAQPCGIYLHLHLLEWEASVRDEKLNCINITFEGEKMQKQVVAPRWSASESRDVVRVPNEV